MPDNSTMGGTDGLTSPSYKLDSGDTAWVMICACLVFLMVKISTPFVILNNSLISFMRFLLNSHPHLDFFMLVLLVRKMHFH